MRQGHIERQGQRGVPSCPSQRKASSCPRSRILRDNTVIGIYKETGIFSEKGTIRETINRQEHTDKEG